ncbi:MAG TPA: bifunctional glutamate N-acetyltransferase/amino-acid acetyltransferase ArgJ, partial [Anaerolineae bacterium]|nr:bifunctional glutamate N-acetyltransferase/amino-acid acetyltransferase ArgJ [Anaerolineae bacterium]
MSHPLTRVPGFQAAGVTCGLKSSGNKDMALIVSDLPCVWAATFTANTFCAAPVLYDKALLEQSGGRGLRAVLINAGIANAVTGARGLQDAEAMARRLEAEAGLPEGSAAVMSTGVIGHLLPMEKIELGIIQAAAALAPEGGADAAEAIMTTDTVPKAAFVQIEAGGRQISIGGIAKGSGMIHPNMATMLATLVTDAPVAPVDLDAALHTAVNRSFNRISVDGDTSTNDTVIVMASGSAGGDELRGEDLAQFTAALTEVCVDLAKQIARDGEGATKLIEIEIKGAKSEEEAVKAAATLATSL